MNPIYQEISSYMEERISEYSQIPENRKKDLEKIADYIKNKLENNEPAKLTFICTHNSRRSHMSQIWAQTASFYYNIDDVTTYSGGTEATAFNPRAVAAMKNAGFKIEKRGNLNNPVYQVYFSQNKSYIKAFSKKYSDEFNPQSGFCAVMTCSDADEACPVVLGAESRVSIPYEDPKAYDGTAKETKMYQERCRQISREMLYMMSRVNL